MTIPPAARRAAEEYIVELIRAVRTGRAAAPRDRRAAHVVLRTLRWQRLTCLAERSAKILPLCHSRPALSAERFGTLAL
jgi:hypothetical protein